MTCKCSRCGTTFLCTNGEKVNGYCSQHVLDYLFPNICGQRTIKGQKDTSRTYCKHSRHLSVVNFGNAPVPKVPRHLHQVNFTKFILTYKALNKLTPPYISALLKPVPETSTRQLRSSENGSLAVPRSRTALYDKSFTYSASKLWNALPCAIKSAPSLSSFKKCVKEYFN